MIPEWMKNVDDSPCGCTPGRGGRKSFIQKTLDGILSFFQESFTAESYSKRKGLLQGLDPRVKLVSILAVVFSLSLTRDMGILLGVYAFELLLAYASLIGIWFFFKRVWLFVPIFTAVIAIPMIFNIFLPGDPLFQVIYLGPGAHLGPFLLPESIYVTKQGLNAAIVFTMRVVVCVSAVVLLFLTTPQQVLFKSLRSVGVPMIFVFTLEMTYRYIFLLTDLIREIYIAKRARTIMSRSMSEEQKWVGGRIGYILIRSLSMSEKVHMAMQSRGFTGDVKILQDFHVGKRDYIAGFIAAIMSLSLVLISQNIIGI
jgi:cobalt/nickel transport system permease protein